MFSHAGNIETFVQVTRAMKNPLCEKCEM